MGIFGSLAGENKEPNDIDLIVFVKDPILIKKILDKRKAEARQDSTEKDPEGYLEEEFFLRLSDEGRARLFSAILEVEFKNNRLHRYPIDFFIIPFPVDEEYLEIEARANLNPNFILYLSKEVRIYDPSKKKFVKQEVFPPTQKNQ